MHAKVPTKVPVKVTGFCVCSAYVHSCSGRCGPYILCPGSRQMLGIAGTGITTANLHCYMQRDRNALRHGHVRQDAAAMDLTIQPLLRTRASEPSKFTPFLCVLGRRSLRYATHCTVPYCLHYFTSTPLGSPDGVAVTCRTREPSGICLRALGLRPVPCLTGVQCNI